MNHRQGVSALTIPIFALLVAGCGSYDDNSDASTAGSTTGATSAGGTGSTATATTDTTTSATNTTGDATTGDGTTGAASTTGDGTTTGGGGPAPEASCDMPTAECGGDAVGSWTVAGSCLELSGEVGIGLSGLGCVEPTSIIGTIEVAGSLTLGDDGSLMDNTTMTGEATLELVGAECKEISGTSTTCDRAGVPLTTLGFSEVVCEDNTDHGGCTCAATFDQTAGPAFPSLNAMETGTYATADSTLTLTYRTTNVDYGYCVADNIMHLTPKTFGNAGTVSGEIVLQK